MIVKNWKENSYNIIIEKGLISQISKYIASYNKVLLITDDNIPFCYYDGLCNDNSVYLFTIKSGEVSKSFENYLSIINTLIDNDFTKKDLILAIGGGVVGDLAGFVSGTFKRGIEYINVPTTLLAMIDSSIGSKTAINHNEVKNVIGVFNDPKYVLIDPDVLKSLPDEQFINGLMESIKCALLHDKKLLSIFINNDFNSIKNYDVLSKIIERTIEVKKYFIEDDYYDDPNIGIRTMLNFGHTIGHALETTFGIYHGYAVALGMIPYCGDFDLFSLLKKYYDFEILQNKIKESISDKITKNALIKKINSDKKAIDGKINVVKLRKVNKPYIEKQSISEIMEAINEICNWK